MLHKLLGYGGPCPDGHSRVTETELGAIVGGSEECHECMAEVLVKVQEGLERDGKRLEQVSNSEMLDRIHNAADRFELR